MCLTVCINVKWRENIKIEIISRKYIESVYQCEEIADSLNKKAGAVTRGIVLDEFFKQVLNE